MIAPAYEEVTVTSKETLRHLQRPSGFAAGYLRFDMEPLHEWQIRFLNWFESFEGVFQAAMVTPNGSGKSSRIVAALALWWIWRWPRGTVILTTKDSKQLDQQAWPWIELGRQNAFGDRAKVVTSPYYEITTDTGGRLIAFTTNDASRVEGYHEKKPDGPVLYIVDEAKSVDPAIFEGIDRNGYNALLYISSPGLQQGPFFEACTKFKIGPDNPDGLFNVAQIGLRDCPHIRPEKIQRMITKYGLNHPVVRSCIFGEFMETQEGLRFVFPITAVNRHFANPPQVKQGDLVAYCDFAAGGDENVLAVRRGNRITLERCWREQDTMAACGQFLMDFRRLGLKPENVYADKGGIGKPMIDALGRMGWELQGVNNGARPFDPVYMHRGAEMWHETAGMMESGTILLPDDEEARKQLTSRQAIFTLDGKLGVLDKKKMREAGLPSPDRADAICGAAASRPMTITDRGPWDRDNTEAWREQDEGGAFSYPAGADPGC